MTLLSSRNATGENFPRVIRTLETEELDLASWITHRIRLEKIVDECLGWLMPENYMIKAVIEF